MKWEKVEMVDDYGIPIDFDCYSEVAIIVEPEYQGPLTASVTYIKNEDKILFELVFNSVKFDSPSTGRVNVKDNPDEKNVAGIASNDKGMSFTVLGLTLERYKDSFEGKLIQLCWKDSSGGYHVTIKAPVYEE